MAKEISFKEFFKETDEKKIKSISFENGLKLMGELVDKVESGELPLEESVQAYEKGAALIKHLQATLTSAEKKLKVIQVKKS